MASLSRRGAAFGQLAVLFTVLGAALALPAGPQAAAAGGAVVGVADASGMRSMYRVPNYLVIETIYDGGGPLAQSVLSNNGDATGFASLPYPGDNVINIGSAISVGTGIPFPYRYPLYVQADAPLTPTAKFSDPSGSLNLVAVAGDTRVSGLAQCAGPKNASVRASASTSTTSVVAGAHGAMIVTADSVTRGLDAGVLQIASVHSHSVTTLSPGSSQPVTKSTIDVVGASVAGQPVQITKDGITLLNQKVGPAYQPVLDALNTSLKKAGIHVALVGNTPMHGGASTSAIEITQTNTLPVSGGPTGTATTVIGNAATSIVSGQGIFGGFGIVPGGNTSGGSTGSNPNHPTGAPPSTSGSVGGTASDGLTPSTGSGGNVPSGTSQPPAVASPQSAGPTLLAANVSSTLGFFYLVIALGAGVAFVASLFWRAKGRALWIS